MYEYLIEVWAVAATLIAWSYYRKANHLNETVATLIYVFESMGETPATVCNRVKQLAREQQQ